MSNINKIKKWLIDEIVFHQPIEDGDEMLTDGTNDICIGRHECASSLLEQREKWENENVNK